MAGAESILEVGGRSVTEANVVARLKITGAFSDMALAFARDAAATQAADDLGLQVSDDELQEAFDDFRRSLELFSANETNSWLESMGLAVEDVESYLEAGLLREKIADKLVSDDHVDRHYAQNPKSFEFARVSHIIVNDKNVAEELTLSLKEEGEDFASLAKAHSIDDSTKCGGGYRGLITRDDTEQLADDVADKIFSADAGEIVGPFESDDVWCIVRVEENGRTPLDDELQGSIRATLCEEQLAERSGL